MTWRRASINHPGLFSTSATLVADSLAEPLARSPSSKRKGTVSRASGSGAYRDRTGDLRLAKPALYACSPRRRNDEIYRFTGFFLLMSRMVEPCKHSGIWRSFVTFL